jgi:hypothetical protein
MSEFAAPLNETKPSVEGIIPDSQVFNCERLIFSLQPENSDSIHIKALEHADRSKTNLIDLSQDI